MSTLEEQWREFASRTMSRVAELLQTHNITLDETQPHIKGERFLIQSLTTISGRKLILLGRETTTERNVVIKVATDYDGMQELLHERTCRTVLHAMNFSYETFHSPAELLFLRSHSMIISVTEFIEQTSSFLERPLEEQFTFTLRALKAQERTRATTATHLKQVTRTYGTRSSEDYLALMDGFVHISQQYRALPEVEKLLVATRQRLTEQKNRIDQYGGFLTHTDFVPHNFRIRDNVLYLLDFSSLRFGNKHESWARFLNFMTLYNRELETLLITYLEKNRSPEERESLQLMRQFRLAELITYYIQTLGKSTGDLLALNTARVKFWYEVLQAEYAHTRVAEDIVTDYTKTRDTLRSTDERKRQENLH